MTEQALRDYFDQKIMVEDLMADVQGSRTRSGLDSISITIEPIDSSASYEVTRNHLLKLCEDALNGLIGPIELNTIAFALSSSDFFSWQGASVVDFEIIDSTIFDWDNPGIGFPITTENLMLWKEYLETGLYKLDPKSLRGTRKKRGTT